MLPDVRMVQQRAMVGTQQLIPGMRGYGNRSESAQRCLTVISASSPFARGSGSAVSARRPFGVDSDAII